MALTPWTCSREDVKSALDSAETARDNALIDDAIAAATDSVSDLTRGRHWYPWTGTRYLDWPNRTYAPSDTLRLPAMHEILSLTAFTAGGVTIAASDYFLEPNDADSRAGFTEIRIDKSSSAAFQSGDTSQRAIVMTGTFGSWSDFRASTVLAEALDASETQIDVATGGGIGVGDLIAVDSERMIVTGRAMASAGQTTQGALTASVANIAVPVTSGLSFAVGETIAIDTERMLIVDIIGNALTVKRAVDGFPLASHTSGTAIYALRSLTVERGATGSTAATHSDTATVYRHHPPPLIRQLTRAEALYARLQEGAGWARQIGSGEGTRQVSESGIRALRERVKAAHRGGIRKAAV